MCSIANIGIEGDYYIREITLRCTMKKLLSKHLSLTMIILQYKCV